MTKSLSLVAALLTAGILSSTTARAQVRLGVKAGANYSDLGGKLYGEYGGKFGPHGGLLANFDVSGDGFFSVQPELLYSQKGYRLDHRQYTVGSFTYKDNGPVNYNYLDLPVLLKINADGLFFEAGPQLSYLLNVKSHVESTVNDVPLTGAPVSGRLEDARRLELGYVAGLGYQSAAGPLIGLRYNGSLSEFGKKDSPATDFNNSRNVAYQLYVGYLFGGK